MVDPSLVNRASQILLQGGLVAFPTETVYGLGADADQEGAVAEVFRVKGRPGTHPLIVHLGSRDQLSEWAAEIPEAALRLATSFWPGPLTLILKKAPRVLKAITGGQETVGLRVPDHPLALALLRDFGGGIAAPSANRFGAVSPTCAEHVRRDLGKDVGFILDGGPCAIGIESTIVDVSTGIPTILRPGGVTRERLEEVLGGRVPVRPTGPVRAPGLLDSHYAPKAQVVIVEPGESRLRAEELRAAGTRVVLLGEEDVAAPKLYSSLRRADDAGAQVIVVPLPSETGLGLAVADRLRKAAGPR